MTDAGSQLPDVHNTSWTSQASYDDVWSPVSAVDQGATSASVVNHPVTSWILQPINHALDSRGPVIVKSGLMFLIVVINVVGNGIALAAFRKKPKLRTKTFLLLYSLTVADLVTAVDIIIYTPYQLVVYVFSANPCDNIILVAVFTAPVRYPLLLTLSHIGVISAERFIAISYPLHYEAWITDRTMRLALAVTWILPAILASSFFSFLSRINRETCTITGAVLQAFVFDSTFIAITFVVTVVLYTRILMVALRQRARINAEVSNLITITNLPYQFRYYTQTPFDKWILDVEEKLPTSGKQTKNFKITMSDE
jgi:7 transmembrane receptor (rhodopsin family)